MTMYGPSSAAALPNAALGLSGRRLGLRRADLGRLSGLIEAACGIKMPPSKGPMLQARLIKRARRLGMFSLSDYCAYLFSEEGIEDELPNMIDAVTTHKTEFFREPSHYEYLRGKALPELLPASERRGKVSIWSAGCSTGEEPYSIAMAVESFMEDYGGPGYSVLATDISRAVIEKARLGVYNLSDVVSLPLELKKKFLSRGRGPNGKLVRVVPRLRSRVSFAELNLMDEKYDIHEKMDVVFFRNVLIYFDKAAQKAILGRVVDHIRPGGLLFIGHSESIIGMGLPLEQQASSIFKRTAPLPGAERAGGGAVSGQPQAAGSLRVSS